MTFLSNLSNIVNIIEAQVNGDEQALNWLVGSSTFSMGEGSTQSMVGKIGGDVGFNALKKEFGEHVRRTDDGSIQFDGTVNHDVAKATLDILENNRGIVPAASYKPKMRDMLPVIGEGETLPITAISSTLHGMPQGHGISAEGIAALEKCGKILTAAATMKAQGVKPSSNGNMTYQTAQNAKPMDGPSANIRA